MLCQNCGKNEGNVKYTQIINGVKKQMTLCGECAQKLGIDTIDFNMPISFSSFLGDMFDDYNQSYIPSLISTKQEICDSCDMLYDEFLNTGKFGCAECYSSFDTRIDQLLKSIQGGNKHIGRVSKRLLNGEKEDTKKESIQKKPAETKENKEKDKLAELEERLKLEIKEERYEDAAKTRDEIKNYKKQ